jgi:hypothetical protein
VSDFEKNEEIRHKQGHKDLQVKQKEKDSTSRSSGKVVEPFSFWSKWRLATVPDCIFYNKCIFCSLFSSFNPHNSPCLQVGVCDSSNLAFLDQNVGNFSRNGDLEQVVTYHFGTSMYQSGFVYDILMVVLIRSSSLTTHYINFKERY